MVHRAFRYRGVAASHKEDLETAVTDLPERVEDAITHIFDEEPSVYGVDDRDFSPLKRGLKPLTKRWIAWHYYASDCFVMPMLRRGITEESPRSITEEEFLTVITQDYDGSGKNCPMFLSGPVGSGKTAFLRYLTSCYSLDWYKKYRSWFLRYNVDSLRSSGQIDRKKLSRDLLSKICHMCDTICNPDLATLLRSAPSLHKGKQQELKLQADHIRKSLQNVAKGSEWGEEQLLQESITQISRILECRLVLILDNIDFVFHVSDNHVFDPGGQAIVRDQAREHNNWPELDSIRDFVNDVLDSNTEIGRINANVLFVMRTDTAQMVQRSLKSISRLSHEFEQGRWCFTIAPRPDDFGNIIARRARLLTFCLNEILLEWADQYPLLTSSITLTPASKVSDDITDILHGNIVAINRSLPTSSTHRHFLGSIQVLRQLCLHLQNPSQRDRIKEMVQFLLRISKDGLRDVMRVFSRFGWVRNGDFKDDSESVGSRFAESLPLSALVHMLGQKQRFSENLSSFPNLFLSHACVADKGKYILPDYWLNFLILSYLDNRTASRDDVFDVFCHPPELHEFDGTESREAPGVFCESVIFYALYNFYRANGPRLIHLDRDLDSESKNLIVTGIRLTDRGREVYGSLSRKFYYLQLVPDDSHLILPADLVSANSAIEYDDGYDTTIGRDKITEFSFLKSRNYSYLVANPVVYRNRVGEVISHKARKLAKFLGILDAARSAEQFRYWATFARLEKDGALIPTARQLLEGVCKEINVLRRVVDGVEVSDDVLLSDLQRYSSKYTDTMYTAYGTIPKGK